MKKLFLIIFFLVVSISILPAFAKESKVSKVSKESDGLKKEVVESLAKLNEETMKILTKKEIHSMIDYPKLLKEYGITYQSDLIVDKNLYTKLKGCQLQQYAGMILFDIMYSASFNKLQEIANGLHTLEAIVKILDLRSHADLKGNSLTALKKLSTEPEKLDFTEVFDQLATDAVAQIPTFMSSKVTAHYMLDVFYGYSLEAIHLLGYFHKTNYNVKLKKWKTQLDTSSVWLNKVVELFESFSKVENTLHLNCSAEKNLDAIKNFASFLNEVNSAIITKKDNKNEFNNRRNDLIKRIEDVRTEITGKTFNLQGDSNTEGSSH
ncbi:MAG: hypothetical protein HQK49_07525 [Oligoflexia bacterium]|nr:hypothetical protein [Oligoflexia bacterium]